MRRYIAEAIGTFGLVLAGPGAIVVNEITGGVGHLGISLTFGFVVAAMIYSVGHISGAHINPAVTLAFALTRRFPWARVPGYWGAQLVGAVAAAAALRLLFGNVAALGATLPLAGAGQAFGLEVLLTFFLMFVIMAVATDVRASGPAAIAIGLTVGLEALWGGPISGASMNPARSFGPALVSGELAFHWIYWAAPILGAALGAFAYEAIRESKPAGETAQEVRA